MSALFITLKEKWKKLTHEFDWNGVQQSNSRLDGWNMQTWFLSIGGLKLSMQWWDVKIQLLQKNVWYYRHEENVQRYQLSSME